MAASGSAVNLDEKFAVITDLWSLKIVGQINDMHIKAVKLEANSSGTSTMTPTSSSSSAPGTQVGEGKCGPDSLWTSSGSLTGHGRASSRRTRELACRRPKPP